VGEDSRAVAFQMLVDGGTMAKKDAASKRLAEMTAGANTLNLLRASDALLPKLNGAMPQLADLARVPKTEEARTNFSRLMVRTVQGVWSDFALSAHPAWKNPRPRPRDAASEEIAARTRRPWYPSGLSERDLEELIWPWPLDVLGGSEQIQPQAHRRGRPKGTIKNRAFQGFVRGLFLAAERAGGRYTLEKNIRKGTVIEAINILAPYLPDGFVPKNLPFSTLQRIKTTLPKRRKRGHHSRTKN
jgi:hypothetical protein